MRRAGEETTRPANDSPPEPILPLVVLALTITASLTGAGSLQLARYFEQKAREAAPLPYVNSFPYKHEASRLRRVALGSGIVAGAGWIVGGMLVLRRRGRKNQGPRGRR